MTETHTGACLCGAVKYTVSGPMREVVYCHCGQCRRQTGLYYAATNARESDVAISGAEEMTWYRSSEKGQRGFCRHCGSALFWKYAGSEEISVLAGSLDLPSRVAPGYHIFCEDKGDFYEITDGLPQYRKSSPDLVTNTE